jgi:hypothetical protein
MPPRHQAILDTIRASLRKPEALFYFRPPSRYQVIDNSGELFYSFPKFYQALNYARQLNTELCRALRTRGELDYPAPHFFFVKEHRYGQIYTKQPSYRA